MLENDQSLAAMAEALARSGEYRVLRRLVPRTSFTPSEGATKTAILLDVETTGRRDHIKRCFDHSKVNGPQDHPL